MLQAILLGSAAGGGVPQWNCRCRVCRLAWDRDPRVRWRTQSSLAVSADGHRWLVVNASPDMREQIAATPELAPRDGVRSSPIAAVLLTNGDVDHVAGLFTLRERQPFSLFASAPVLRALAANPVFDVLHAGTVARREIAPDVLFEPLPGLAVTLFAVPGKVPLWQEDDAAADPAEAWTVGVEIRSRDARLVSIPGCAAIDERVSRMADGADVLLFDGTVWRDDELITAGLGTKTGRRMGHLAIDGEDGAIAGLRHVAAARRVFVHINNSNPILVDGSPEQRQVAAAGWEVGYDGWRVNL